MKEDNKNLIDEMIEKKRIKEVNSQPREKLFNRHVQRLSDIIGLNIRGAAHLPLQL